MVFEHIEKLKREYTDKYVVVDAARPELRRFRGLTGTVRTVNMSGRALVEFDGHANIGWYDIDVDFLKVIDAPLPKPEAKAAHKAPEKAEAPAEAAKPVKKEAAKPAGAAKSMGAAAKMSVEEMLAAARGGLKAPAAKAAPTEKKAPAEKMAAAEKQAPDAKKPGAKMSVEEMLAAARGEKKSPPAGATEHETASDAAGVEASAAPKAVEKTEKQPAKSAEAPKAEKKGAPPNSAADIIAMCRQQDAKK